MGRHCRSVISRWSPPLPSIASFSIMRHLVIPQPRREATNWSNPSWSPGIYIFSEELWYISEEAIWANQPELSQKTPSKFDTLEQDNASRGHLYEVRCMRVEGKCDKGLYRRFYPPVKRIEFGCNRCWFWETQSRRNQVFVNSTKRNKKRHRIE